MPGSGKQSAEVQRQIIEFLEAGIDPTTIHRRLKVGRSSIYRMKRSLQQHGSAYAPPETNKKNGRPKVMSAEQELEICTWLRDPKNRERYLDDMVWFIHDRFGMVCSTTTCSKIKRKWLKVLEAEERGEHLDPAEAQEQVRQEGVRVGKKPASHVVIRPEHLIQSRDDNAGVTPQHTEMQMSEALGMATTLHQQQPLPQYVPQIDQSLDEFKPPPTEQELQEQLQTEVAHAALHQSGL